MKLVILVVTILINMACGEDVSYCKKDSDCPNNLPVPNADADKCGLVVA